MHLQGLAALVKGDGVLKIDFPLLQPGDNGLQLAQGGFETKAADLVRGAGRGDGTAPDAGGWTLAG